MKILVMGGAGRLGSIVVKILSERHHDVRVFDLPSVDFTSISSIRGVELLKGDIVDYPQVQEAVKGIDAVIHLTAILPPDSEKNKEKTMAINLAGTENVLMAMKEVSPNAEIVFSSSVSIYGNTIKEVPLTIDHPIVASDYYSESKMRAEERVRDSKVPYTVLRISGISIAEVFEFPEVMPFKADQRIEFIYRDDAALALVSALEKTWCRNQTFNVAGGKTWQMTGNDYVKKICEAIGIDIKVNFPKEYSWLDWYDTDQSQKILDYQKTPFNRFLEKLKTAFE